MCDLCGTFEETKQGKRACRYMAERLDKMRHHYMQLAIGAVKPHTEEAKKSELNAKLIIRKLVEDYI